MKTMDAIIREVSEERGVPLLDLLSERRDRRTAWARQEIYYRGRHETYASLGTIARLLRRADHTTVIHGIKAHEKRMGAHGGA